MGPLTGLKVIDLTHVMAGPTCTLMLADMGAEVIKIEKAPSGDDTRHMIPPKIGEEAAAFLMMNRNKRGIVLDLKTEGGKSILRRLIATADVLVENFAPGVMERLGFGYEDLRKDYPSLIYCSLSGFGRTGPYKHRRGFDLVAQAMSGIMSFTGESPHGPPVKCGAPLSDITAGILAAMGILAAYTHRLKTGQGQWVETSLLEAALVQTYWQSAIALATGVAPRAMGSAHPLNAPYQAFEALDGWIVVGGANQKNWLRMLDALNAPELADDPRFQSGADRMAHLKELEAELGRRFRTKPAKYWLTALEDKGVRVLFAIHPVAGRMPGHMNVLLAESQVPYDALKEMDEVNPEFARTDVTLVIGANDVTNPAAKNEPGSPIYGMPILEVDRSQSVIVLKRSMASGFAGIDNPLFYEPQTSMLFGDAKSSVSEITAAVASL